MLRGQRLPTASSAPDLSLRAPLHLPLFLPPLLSSTAHALMRRTFMWHPHISTIPFWLSSHWGERKELVKFSWAERHTAVIPVLWEPEAGGQKVWAQPEQISDPGSCLDIFLINTSRMHCGEPAQIHDLLFMSPSLVPPFISVSLTLAEDLTPYFLLRIFYLLLIYLYFGFLK